MSEIFMLMGVDDFSSPTALGVFGDQDTAEDACKTYRKGVANETIHYSDFDEYRIYRYEVGTLIARIWEEEPVWKFRVDNKIRRY